MPLIFGGTRKLRSLKPELVIEVIVYVIFVQSKDFQYRRTGVLRFDVFWTYSSVFGLIVTEIAMIGTFGNTN